MYSTYNKKAIYNYYKSLPSLFVLGNLRNVGSIFTAFSLAYLPENVVKIDTKGVILRMYDKLCFANFKLNKHGE